MLESWIFKLIETSLELPAEYTAVHNTENSFLSQQANGNFIVPLPSSDGRLYALLKRLANQQRMALIRESE